jgi:hypothetical protein
MKTRFSCLVLFALLGLAWSGCVRVPAEVVQLHAKEITIVGELRRTHLALVDSYVDVRLAGFEEFYFKTYGPEFLTNWKAEFKRVKGRDYDEAKDFALLHQDLVATYQDKIKPIEALRTELKEAILAAYAQHKQSHEAVQAWLLSAKKLNDTERALTNKLLGAIDPKLSLEAVDRKIDELRTQLTNPN